MADMDMERAKEGEVARADLAGRAADIPERTEAQSKSSSPELVRNEKLNAAGSRDWVVEPETGDNKVAQPDGGTPLFSDSEVNDLRSRWSDVQAGFVDEPRHAVEEADQLVATVVQKITSGFANERTSLEKQWDHGDNVSTEDLRMALQRYRAFFGRLLNAA